MEERSRNTDKTRTLNGELDLDLFYFTERRGAQTKTFLISSGLIDEPLDQFDCHFDKPSNGLRQSFFYIYY